MLGCDWGLFLTTEDDVCWQIVVATWLICVPLGWLGLPTIALEKELRGGREARLARSYREAIEYHKTGLVPKVPWYERPIGCVYHVLIGTPAIFAYLAAFILAITRTVVFVF